MPHLNFDFTAVQVLWTLTFAGLLVLLVVLLGRDRVGRFPWFTTSIVVVALGKLASRLLYQRVPQITSATIFITLAVVSMILGLLVLVELARVAFKGLGRSSWIVNVVGALLVAFGVAAVWGPWPAWKTVTANSLIGVLQVAQLAAVKGDLLADVLAVELGLLIVLFGRRFSGGWRSHAQQITIGLSTVALGHLTVQGFWQLIALKAAPHTQAEYNRVIGLRDKLTTANGALYVAVLVWWIVCLWIDEPGTAGPDEPSPGDDTLPVGVTDEVTEVVLEEPPAEVEEPASGELEAEK
ncbi:MAG: hypothetical protein ABR956_05940 [Terracidiphilus sp.]|jgi:hypothetical protein